jgi:hypothetical protein
MNYSFVPTIGIPSTSPPFKNILIIYVIIDGASCSLPVQSVSHFMMIMKSMNPNRHSKNTNYGINSKKKSIADPLCILLAPFIRTPNVIYITPYNTDNFILNEFKKFNSLELKYHLGSIPKG